MGGRSLGNGYYLPDCMTYVPKCKKCYEKCEQCNDYMNCTKCKNETSYDLSIGHWLLYNNKPLKKDLMMNLLRRES